MDLLPEIACVSDDPYNSSPEEVRNLAKNGDFKGLKFRRSGLICGFIWFHRMMMDDNGVSYDLIWLYIRFDMFFFGCFYEIMLGY